MNNFQIPPQLIQVMKGGNPQQALIGMLQQNTQNPMVSNVLSMVNNNNMSGVEQLVRNVCKSKGIDADELYNQVKNQFQ